MQKIVLASDNKGKLIELHALLADSGLDVVAQSEFGIVSAEETGTTFIENAILKARHAARLSGLSALADDSGLCVDALNGAPGLISAHYAGTHGDAVGNMRKLLAELEGVPDAERGAYFYSVIVLLRRADDPAPLIGEGRWSGRILHAPRGSGGFGYNPVFLDLELGQSAAELEPEVKNRVSARGRALSALKARLATSLSSGQKD